MSRSRQILHRLSRPALLGRSGTWHCPSSCFLLITLAAVGRWASFPQALQKCDAAVRLLRLLMWSASSLALLAEIWLNTRIVHYGFYMALPTTTGRDR